MISVLRILEDTTVDGPGFRTAIYAAGCPNACPGCHNPESWDMAHGHPMAVEDILAVVRADEFADVTFTGGDPMFQAAGFARLARAVKKQTGKNIWCYTGFVFESLLDRPEQRALLTWIDVLVDGPFVQAERTTELLFRGSRNQRLIDVQASLREGHTVLWQPDAVGLYGSRTDV